MDQNKSIDDIVDVTKPPIREIYVFKDFEDGEEEQQRYGLKSEMDYFDEGSHSLKQLKPVKSN